VALCGSFAVLPLVSLVHRAPEGRGVTRVAVSASTPRATRPGSLDATIAAPIAADVLSAPVTDPPAPAVSQAPVVALVAHTAGRNLVPTTLARSGTSGPVPPVTKLPPTTAPRPKPPVPPAPPVNVDYGVATWLDTIPTGTCANNAAAMGTILTVTDVDTGVAVKCRVVSTGPFWPGRIVDLAVQTFAALAPPSLGVINVRVTW